MKEQLSPERTAMTEANGNDTRMASANRSGKPGGRLAETLRLIREREGLANAGDANPTPDDEARKALGLLLDDLRDVIDDLPKDVDFFEFNLSHGAPPRLWIDAVSFVVMAENNIGFRMLKHTRGGRILLKECLERADMEAAIVDYVARRLARREADMGPATARAAASRQIEQAAAVTESNRSDRRYGSRPSSRMASLAWFLAGTIVGAAALLGLAWFRADITALLAKL